MNLDRVRSVLPLLIGILFIILAFERPHQRIAWLFIGLMFIIVGVRRRRGLRGGAKPDV